MSFLYTKSLNFEKTVKNNEKIILIYNSEKKEFEKKIRFFVL